MSEASEGLATRAAAGRELSDGVCSWKRRLAVERGVNYSSGERLARRGGYLCERGKEREKWCSPFLTADGGGDLGLSEVWEPSGEEGWCDR